MDGIRKWKETLTPRETKTFQDSKTLSTHLQFSFFFFSYLFFLPPEQMKTKKTNFFFFKKKVHYMKLFSLLLFDSGNCGIIDLAFSSSQIRGSLIQDIPIFFSPWGHLQGHRKANSCKQGAQVIGEVKSLHPVNTNTGVCLSLERCSSKHVYLFFSCNAYRNKKSFRDERNNNFKSA